MVSYTSVVAARAKVGNLDAAECWLVKLEHKGLDADVVSYTSVFAAWAKVGRSGHSGWLGRGRGWEARRSGALADEAGGQGLGCGRGELHLSGCHVGKGRSPGRSGSLACET